MPEPTLDASAVPVYAAADWTEAGIIDDRAHAEGATLIYYYLVGRARKYQAMYKGSGAGTYASLLEARFVLLETDAGLRPWHTPPASEE